MTISKRIKELRTLHNLSMSALARAINVDHKSVSNWESGNCEPKATYIIKLASYFGVTADYLLGMTDI